MPSANNRTLPQIAGKFCVSRVTHAFTLFLPLGSASQGAPSFYTGIFFAREYFVWMVLFLKFVLTLGFGLVILALL